MRSERMEALLRLTPRCKRALDLGCDHGIVSQMLLEDHICDEIIASDINGEPLERCVRRLIGAGLGGRAEFRRGDGLEVITPGEVEACLIAGMGGTLIAAILGHPNARTVGCFILQPASRADELRRYLRGNGWMIDAEELVLENRRYYFTMRARPGEMRWSDKEDTAGPLLLARRHPLLPGYLQWQKKVVSRAIRQAGPTAALSLKLRAVQEAIEWISAR